MLKKRIVPCLDIADGRTVKGVNFHDLIDAGDPVLLAQKYSDLGADELVFLDITATVEKRPTLIRLVEQISAVINIPFSVGGGISTVEQTRELISAGADKVTINSAAVSRPELISELTSQFGSQCIITAVDYKMIDGVARVHTHGGRRATDLRLQDWSQQLVDLGAGELLLTSMDHDGTKQGYDLEILAQIDALCAVPVIASGGAGTVEHFADLFAQTAVSAALAASIFHFGEIEIPDLKAQLKQRNIAIR